MIVKDEERSLKRCLLAARPFVDEMIVVDTGSTDDTKKIAREAGAKVYDFVWVRDFSAARNYALGKSDADWNLVLDADEYLRPFSRKQLEEVLGKGDRRYGLNGWMGAVLRFDSYRDAVDESREGVGEAELCVHSALLPRVLPGFVRYRGRIHEQPDCELPCMLLPLEADHDGYLVEGKSERNLTYLREAVAEEPENSYYWYQMAVTLRELKQWEESLIWFRRLWKAGADAAESYRTDGILRYLYTLMDLGTSGYLEEAKDVIDTARPFLENRSDFCFVCGLFYMKLVLSDVARYLSYLPRIEASYLACLEIGEHPEAETVAGTGSFKAAYNLGVWYELSGRPLEAKRYYGQAAGDGYKPAEERLKNL